MPDIEYDAVVTFRMGEVQADVALEFERTVKSADAYLRLIPRTEMDIAVVGLGVSLTIKDGVCTAARVGLGAVAPTVIRAPRAEAALEGRKPDAALLEAAVQAALEEVHPISDVRASDWYRRELVHNMLKRVLTHVCQL